MQTRWGQGDHSLSSLYASTSSSAAVSVSLDTLGRYSASARTTAAWVTVKDYVSASYADEITTISEPWISNQSSARGQLSCDGWSDSWTGNPSWTFTDCGPAATPTPIYQCSAVDGSTPASTIDGIPASTGTLFRDGHEHLVTWTPQAPTGTDLVVTDTSTRWTRAGTPWRENNLSVSEANVSLAPHADGNSIFNSDAGTSWVSGIKDSAYVKGYWASTQGAPTVVQPLYQYFGTMSEPSVTITGIGSDGSWTTSPSTITVDSSAVCTGDAVSLNYVRATQQAR
jgi:hypothetical protein